MSAYARIENGQVVDRRISPTDTGTWLPVLVERPDIDRATHDEIAQTNIESECVRIVYVAVPRAVQPGDVIAERERRLALGFDYNFGDSRGVHRIGTTKRDLEGWDEVSKYAGALIDAGHTSTQIHIATDTGPCVVTPIEWRAIEIASAQYRQPLWAKSFALMESNPIPADYTNDSYWT